MTSTRTWAVAALVVAVLCLAESARAADTQTAVDQLATQITVALPEGRQVRIVVPPFADPQGGISDYGRLVADRLILKLALNSRLLVIERRTLGPVLAQLKLAPADLVKPENARLLVKQLGAEVIVLGSMTEFAGEINLQARIVEIVSGDTLGFAAAGATKDSKVTRMLETGRQ